MDNSNLNKRKWLKNKKYKKKYNLVNDSTTSNIKNSERNQKEEDNAEKHVNLIVEQPKSSYADLDQAQISDDDIGHDFIDLINIPITENFKTENKLATYTSQDSEFFSLDLNRLSSAIECIPFNEYADIDKNYFTGDQLIHMANLADINKHNHIKVLQKNNGEKYKEPKCLNDLNKENSAEVHVEKSNSPKLTGYTSQNETDVLDLEKDLSNLLLLKDPVEPNPIMNFISFESSVNDIKVETTSVPTKSIDLEKWLDSVLDD